MGKRCSAIVALCLLGYLSLMTTRLAAETKPTWTLSVNLRGQQLEGFPLEATATHVALLCRDGQLVEFSPSEVTDFKATSPTFRPYSSSEMRAELLREFSPKLEVTGTGHYLVAHPPGQGDKWANRFEELYRSMAHYFGVRGFQMKDPEFPLVAIVWNSREDFLRYAAKTGDRVPPGVIGYYSPRTNRITLYDMAGGNKIAGAWQQNASTIVHEATHQTAFNTGLHRRFAETPTWVIEGLGTLFEPRGVWNSQDYPQQEDRINRERLDYFKSYQKAGRPPLGIMQIIADDRLFQTNPLAAYAEAWALTFYLTERMPQKYSQYLTKMAALKPFERYSKDHRVADFQSVFGSDVRMLDANFLRFMNDLK
jgi:hypothetical protein